jgi:hypothetical protein
MTVQQQQRKMERKKEKSLKSKARVKNDVYRLLETDNVFYNAMTYTY